MSDPVSSHESALSACELLILHTEDGQEWAAYLQQIVKSSRKLRKVSILLYPVGPGDQLHGYSSQHFQRCKCIVLLLTGAFLDLLYDSEAQGALQRVLYPPHRVVALLCGVSQDEVLTESFEDWLNWRKISSEDEPAVYISTILDSINDNRAAEPKHKSRAAAVTKLDMTEASSNKSPVSIGTEEAVSEGKKEPAPKAAPTGKSTNLEISTPTSLPCITIQPNRVLCGEREKLFIIFTHEVQSAPEVEFSSSNHPAKTVQGTVENQYTLSVFAPDMPAGVVSLTIYTEQTCISLGHVTYYTTMGEVSRLLENAADPVSFMCQAFNFMSRDTEALDNMLSDSLKSRMPADRLQVFGIKQIEEDNMAAYQRTEECPTLLHFAAKYGFKKLTTILLHCPGALQAYSVMNKYGDYPNTLAEKNGFTDLRQFMDDFVETADILKSHMEDSMNTEEAGQVYEEMSAGSQDMVMKYSGCSEDIYESMLRLEPQCAEDFYEVMNAVDENPVETLLRKFFEAKPHTNENQEQDKQVNREKEETDIQNNKTEQEEDPYNLFPEDIYDTVDGDSTYNSIILPRPPAPIPRPESDPEKQMTYISRVFTDKGPSQRESKGIGRPEARPVADPPSPTYDPFAGMKTPGQKQLISLQERVKVGEITVDEAVEEFKAWQLDHDRRASSIRYQQDNLKQLRDSITRRHKEKNKNKKDLEYEISAPMQRSLYWGSGGTMECSVYESTPRMEVQPQPPAPATHNIQRGSWKTGSTSSTSSNDSNRLSTHSTFSYSSGTEPDCEDTMENLPPPPRPPRPSDVAAPPRIPPRVPERVPEKGPDRYVSCPTRAIPQRPTGKLPELAPPIPRRQR